MSFSARHTHIWSVYLMASLGKLVPVASLVLSCAFGVVISADGSVQKAPKLESYLVNKNLMSVSGFSSGGYFSVQLHVAFSNEFMGAGILAGGPYMCAQDLNTCIYDPALISVAKLVSLTNIAAQNHEIDSTSNLKNDRVYLFSGIMDTIVNPEVVRKLRDYYLNFIDEDSLETEFTIPAEHAMITNDYGNFCSTLITPYINNCYYPAAYNLLQHIYGDIEPANGSMAKPENLLEFDQSDFFSGSVSMDNTAYIYVPTNCKNKTKECRLHLAFHGCLQGRVFISDVFALHAGYNGVAEANNIIILYAQVTVSELTNPYGCWDWWGYTSSNYAYKNGPQMAAIKLMLDRVTGSSYHHESKQEYMLV